MEIYLMSCYHFQFCTKNYLLMFHIFFVDTIFKYFMGLLSCGLLPVKLRTLMFFRIYFCLKYF